MTVMRTIVATETKIKDLTDGILPDNCVKLVDDKIRSQLSHLEG